MPEETNVPHVRVRKCKNGKSYRYRYKLKNKDFLEDDLTMKQLNEMSQIKFSFAPSMTDSDQAHVNKRFEAKLIA